MDETTATPRFLSGGGEIGELMRTADWSGSALGVPSGWPPALQTTVGLMLNSKFPMFLAWGEALLFLYNDAYSDVLGAKHPTALGRPFREIWDEIWDDLRPLIDKALAGEASYQENMPLLMRRKGYDEQTWFTFSYSPLRDDTGDVVGMYCACVETTAQVLAERSRLEENERLRRLFAQAPGFMAVLHGADHVFELVNDAYYQLVGHRPLLGMPVREALPEVATQGFMTLLDQVYRTGEVVTGKAAALTLQPAAMSTPEERFVDFVYQPIFGSDGRVTGIFVEGSDVTEAALASAALTELNQTLEQRIAEAVAQLDRVWRNSRDMLLVVDRQGMIRAANPAWELTLGYAEDELVGRALATLIHTDDWVPIAALALTASPEAPLENRVRHRDGGWRVLSWTAASEGEAIYCVGRDVTTVRAAMDALQHAEEQLRQSQKMEAIGQLTGGIAHDFNNLLQVIEGNLQLTQRFPDRDTKVARWTRASLEAVQRGTRLTSQLLTFSRSQRLVRQAVGSSSLIHGLAELLGRTLGPATTIELDLDPTDPSVLVDETQLEMALINLAINARDAMPEGGRLQLRTRQCAVVDDPELDDGGYVEISVADTGTGMPADVRARAFDPFFTTKAAGKGTGLGLSQVYGFARQVGGSARLDSREGHGTTVRLLLQGASPLSPPKREPQGQPLVPGDNATVLLVDDDDEVRRVVADYLQALGLTVEAVDSGEAALAYLERDCPDLLLVDFAMAGMNGADVARAARVRHADLPVIFATGYADTEAMEAALGSDAVILRKPFSLEQLAAGIARVRARPGE